MTMTADQPSKNHRQVVEGKTDDARTLVVDTRDRLGLEPGWHPDTDTFGSRLLALRKRLGLIVDELAPACSIAPATWSNWENGGRPRRLDEVVREIAEVTGVDPLWLMWGQGTPDFLQRRVEQTGDAARGGQNLKKMRGRVRPRDNRPADRAETARTAA